MLRKVAAFGPLTVLAVMLTAGVAAADPVSDGFTSAQTGITGYITNNALPLVIAVLLVGLGIGLLVKFVRKGVRAA